MKRFVEFFEQQDGAMCILNLGVGIGVIAFWTVWIVVSLRNHNLSDMPANLGLFLTAGFGTKVVKDFVDYRTSTTIPTPTVTSTSTATPTPTIPQPIIAPTTPP